ADGAYTFTITQTDAASNTGSSGAQTITVDRTTPVVGLTLVNGTGRTFPLSINVTATSVGGTCGTAAGDSAAVAITVTGAGSKNGTAPCSPGTWTSPFSSPLAPTGTYNVTATQSDTAGNVGTSGAKAITIQTAAPTITLTTVNGVARTFPYSTNATVTIFGGTCTTAAGVNTSIPVTITGASTQNGTATCTPSACR